MPADPSTIPASITVTNATAGRFSVAGLQIFEPGEVRTVTLSAFGLAQRAAIWNALTVALGRGYLTSGTAGFEVTSLYTGHQNTDGHGGQDRT